MTWDGACGSVINKRETVILFLNLLHNNNKHSQAFKTKFYCISDTRLVDKACVYVCKFTKLFLIPQITVDMPHVCWRQAPVQCTPMKTGLLWRTLTRLPSHEYRSPVVFERRET